MTSILKEQQEKKGTYDYNIEQFTDKALVEFKALLSSYPPPKNEKQNRFYQNITTYMSQAESCLKRKEFPPALSSLFSAYFSLGKYDDLFPPKRTPSGFLKKAFVPIKYL